ncbi:hypothetical protein BJX99DRAFT_195667 [Aspergillus californicus]
MQVGRSQQNNLWVRSSPTTRFSTSSDDHDLEYLPLQCHVLHDPDPQGHTAVNHAWLTSKSN